MKQINPFYTVIETQSGRFAVRYITPPDWTVQEIGMHYDDPADAAREFKTYEHFRQHEHLPKAAFERRVRQHEQEAAKLKSWIGAKA